MKLFELGGSPESGQDNAAQRALIQNELLKWCPILAYCEFYPIVGSADKPLKASSATGGSERAINDTFAEDVADPIYGDVSLKIYGGKILVDDAHVRRHAGDKYLELASLRLREMKQWARRVGQNLQYAIFNNATSSDAKKWNGIMTQVPASRVASLSASIATAANVGTLIEKIRLGIADVPGGAQFVAMDAIVLSKISSYAAGLVQMGVNELGQQVSTIDRVPILVSGYNAAGTRVLPWTTGGSSNATKVVIGRSSEQADIAFISNTGLVVKDLGLIHPHWTTSVEMDIDCVLLNDEAVYVIDEVQP